MKLTNTKTNKSNKGMTLIELTVVILVLLSLISVLFIGARAWMRGSDRANAALLIRNAQQGVRSHANIMGVDSGATAVDWPTDLGTLRNEVFGEGKYVENGTDAAGMPKADGLLPDHPGNEENQGVDLDQPNQVPALGTLYMTSDVDSDFYDPKGLQ